jgi:hypothetical protein
MAKARHEAVAQPRERAHRARAERTSEPLPARATGQERTGGGLVRVETLFYDRAHRRAARTSMQQSTMIAVHSASARAMESDTVD